MVVRCECCVLSGRGLCDGLITRPEESCRLWCFLMCDLEISRMRRLKLIKGCKYKKKCTNAECIKILGFFIFFIVIDK